MALPAGVLTATITYGKSYDAFGQNADVTVRITPSHRLLWEATGDYVADFEVTSAADAGVVGSFLLPRDQDGFLNSSGDAIRGWYYTAIVTERRGNAAKSYRKVFTVAEDQSAIDLDALPIDAIVQPPGSAPIPAVTSVNGQAGAVVVEGADASTVSAAVVEGLTSPALQAIADADEIKSTIAAGAASAAKVDAFTRAPAAPAGAATGMTDTGQAIDQFGVASAWTQSSGLYTTTHTGSANSAKYWQVKVAGDYVRRIFATIKATAGQQASIALVIAENQWRADGTGPLGPAGVHYVAAPDGGWHIDFWNGSAVETYMSGTGPAWNDGTEKYVEILVDTVTSSVTITHPNGTTSTVSDPRILANLGPWAILESYSTTGAHVSFGVKEWGASTFAPVSGDAFATRAALAALAAVGPITAETSSELTYVAPTGSAASVNDTETLLSFVAPTSGKATVEYSFYVESTDAAVRYLVGLNNGSGATTTFSGGSLRTVLTGTFKGVITVQFTLTGMTPGAIAKPVLRHLATVAAVVTIKAGGSNAYAPIKRQSTPLAA